ncbi:splicing factor 3B subunit 4-like [Hibiscus syriacus]|uniref:splicing factor 3B subunit 4-like n=1 Tax=Hibiscus syriacus TaxID=106335 RepID=UPI001923344E|nr:splicing factor 3B subunit 4-like [Hibiscus syriacus]
MHKDHLLWLEISVPIECMVCKDMCSSWRYRCKDCSFHLCLGCILAPCEEETTMSRTRSLGTPAPPPPSAWLPVFDAYNCGYGYGAIPYPLQYIAQTSFPPHVHGYGGIAPPPPQYFAPPPFPPHVHGYWGIPPQQFAQPSFPPHDHGYGTPSNYHAQSSGSQVEGHGGFGKVGKRMYAIVQSLALSVVGNLITGTLI